MMQFTPRSSTVLKYLIYNFTFEDKAISKKLLFTVLILTKRCQSYRRENRLKFPQVNWTFTVYLLLLQFPLLFRF